MGNCADQRLRMRSLHCPGHFLIGGLEMGGEANCFWCNKDRTLTASAPVARGYFLKRYECSSCGIAVRLVSRTVRTGKRSRRPPIRATRPH
jgi:hypothetical protein